jgi:hypothetical protein
MQFSPLNHRWRAGGAVQTFRREKMAGKWPGTWRWSALTPCLQSDSRRTFNVSMGKRTVRSWSAPFPGSGNIRKIKYCEDINDVHTTKTRTRVILFAKRLGAFLIQTTCTRGFSPRAIVRRFYTLLAWRHSKTRTIKRIY